MTLPVDYFRMSSPATFRKISSPLRQNLGLENSDIVEVDIQTISYSVGMNFQGDDENDQ